MTSRILWTLLCGSSLALAGPAWALAEDSPTMFRYDPAHLGRSPMGPIAVQGLAWRFTTGGKVRSTPAIAGGLAVFGSEDGFLYAVDVKKGTLAWKARIGGDVSSSPAIARSLVVEMGRDGTLRALNLRDGTPVWSFATGPDHPSGDDPRLFDFWPSSPTIDEGTVFVGSGDGKVYAVDLRAGRPKWSYATEQRVRSSPAVAGGRVFVGSFDGNIYCLDAASGALQWKFQTGGEVQSSPAVARGKVFVGSRSMAVFALDATTGRLAWRRPHSGSWILASAAVADGQVIVGGSDSHLLEALDAETGDVAWSVPTGARVLGSVTVMGGVLVYGAEDFRVYTADRATGLGLSMEFTEGAIYSSVVPTGDVVLAGSDDNHMYAFKAIPTQVEGDSAPQDLLEAAGGQYRLDSGDVYTLSLHNGRLRLDYCNYPPGLVTVRADGSFSCPYLFGLKGRLLRASGRPASALVLSQDGHEVVARRLP